jgi:hypothetical protein
MILCGPRSARRSFVTSPRRGTPALLSNVPRGTSAWRRSTEARIHPEMAATILRRRSAVARSSLHHVAADARGTNGRRGNISQAAFEASTQLPGDDSAAGDLPLLIAPGVMLVWTRMSPKEEPKPTNGTVRPGPSRRRPRWVCVGRPYRGGLPRGPPGAGHAGVSFPAAATFRVHPRCRSRLRSTTWSPRSQTTAADSIPGG